MMIFSTFSTYFSKYYENVLSIFLVLKKLFKYLNNIQESELPG